LYTNPTRLAIIVSAEFKCPNFAELECPFFDVDNKNPSSRQVSFCRELDGFLAIIYLASHTGLRMADIVNLRLTDIDWRKNEINIIQIKTGQPIKIPMETDVGNAIADYVLKGRPSTDSHYVFIRTIAPYKKLENRGTGRNILKKYLNSAGIVHLPWDGKGFHALRRSMGTWMLEADVPLSVISQVLGHRKLDSTKQYLSLHYSMLTKCALNLQGLETRREELL
jgi:integrase